jgi:hypothetical protein
MTMMIKRRLAAGLLAAATAGTLAVAVPAAQAAPAAARPAPAAAMAPAAMGMMHLEAALRGGYPHAAGHADYQSGYGYRYLDVQVWNIRRLAGSRLVVYVHGTRAGTMTVSRSGYAHLYLGRGVPACQAGQPVRVRTAKGALIASGTFYRMR